MKTYQRREGPGSFDQRDDRNLPAKQVGRQIRQPIDLTLTSTKPECLLLFYLGPGEIRALGLPRRQASFGRGARPPASPAVRRHGPLGPVVRFRVPAGPLFQLHFDEFQRRGPGIGQ
jgi:hypothetical protein